MNKNEMVSVSRETLERIIGCGKTGFPVTDFAFALLREILDMPAEQHQGEPVALPARKADPTEESDVFTDAENSGFNACLDEIAKLGPLFTCPVQGEPIAEIVSAYSGDPDSKGNRRVKELTVLPPIGTLLYTHTDAGEVERLRADRDDLHRYANDLNDERCGFEKKIDTLRAQLAERDALLREVDPLLENLGCRLAFPPKDAPPEVGEAGRMSGRIRILLSTGAEPSAPKCGTCNDLGHVPDGEITDVGGVEFENGPVECLKDCPDCTPVERDGLEGVEDVAKSIGERMKSRAALERKS